MCLTVLLITTVARDVALYSREEGSIAGVTVDWVVHFGVIYFVGWYWYKYLKKNGTELFTKTPAQSRERSSSTRDSGTAFIEVPDGLVTDIDIEKLDSSQPYEDKDFPTTYSSFI